MSRIFCHRVQPIEKNDNAELFVRLNFAPKELWNLLSEKSPGEYAVSVSLKPIESEASCHVRVLWLNEVPVNLGQASVSDDMAKLITQGSQTTGDVLTAVLPTATGIPWLIIPGTLLKTGGAIGQQLLGSSKMDVCQAFIFNERTFGWRFGVGPFAAPVGLVDLDARMALDLAITKLEVSICLWLKGDEDPCFMLRRTVEVSTMAGG